MTQMTCARQRLAAAIDLPAVLDAAYEAFEDMLAVLRRHQEDDESTFPAFVLAAAAAANGRDWIAGADTLPEGSPQDRAGDVLEDAAVADVARAVAELSRELAARLTSAAAAAIGSAGDRGCCEHAVSEAAAITALLGGVNPP